MADREAPKVISVEDILAGCTCAVMTGFFDTPTVVRCVTCPVHGDEEFRQKEEQPV